jgi:ribosomal protein S6
MLRSTSNYELFIHLSQDITSSGLTTVLKKINEFISRNSSGSIKKIEYLGLTKLAYKIGKSSRSRAIIIYFSTKPSSLAAISHYLAVNDAIIRSLNTKINSIPSEPSPIAISSKSSIDIDEKEKDYQKSCEEFLKVISQ